MSTEKMRPPRHIKLTWPIQCAMAGIFLIVSVLIRAPILARSVLDWDESLYLLMAEQWRAGHLPYTNIWDNKPIGIYLIFMTFIDLIGRPILAIRLASDLFITANAFILFNITHLLLAGRAEPMRLRLAIFAALAYAIGSLSNDGLAANTEIFMTCFTALAMLLALIPMAEGRISLLHCAACGALLGLAVMTKYVAIFEAPALAFALLQLNQARSKSAGLWRLLACGAGGLLPLMATLFLYIEAGLLPLWWQASVASNVIRIAGASAPTIGSVILYQLQNWAPLYLCVPLLAVLWALSPPARPARRIMIFVYLWLLGGLIGVCAAKSFFDHYFLQSLPVLCLIAALTLAASPVILRRIIIIAMLLPAIAGWNQLANVAAPIITFQNGHLAIRPDIQARIAADLTAALQPGQHIYVFDDQPIIYSLTNQTPPTKYAFPPDLTTRFLANVAGINAYHEVSRILATHPEFIIRSLDPLTAPSQRNNAVYQLVDQTLSRNYDIWKTVGDSVIFRLVNTKPPALDQPSLNSQSPARH